MSDAASGDPPIYRRSASKVVLAVLAAVALGSATALVASAHEGATGIVGERMRAMEEVGDAMKVITAMFRGQTDYDADVVSEAAEVIAGHGGEQLTRLFPDGSLDHPTEALPTIWQDWDRFESLARDLSVFAGTLSAAADNPQPSGGAMGTGMMGGQSSMMGQQSPMLGGQNPMMGGNPNMGAMVDPELLAEMPPQASFMRLSQVCNACHTRFRKEQ